MQFSTQFHYTKEQEKQQHLHLPTSSKKHAATQHKNIFKFTTFIKLFILIILLEDNLLKMPRVNAAQKKKMMPKRKSKKPSSGSKGGGSSSFLDNKNGMGEDSDYALRVTEIILEVAQ